MNALLCKQKEVNKGKSVGEHLIIRQLNLSYNNISLLKRPVLEPPKSKKAQAEEPEIDQNYDIIFIS